MMIFLDDLSDSKFQLRRLLRRRRSEYHASVNQSMIDIQLIKQWKLLSSSLALKPQLIIAGYYPTGAELNILALLDYLGGEGYQLALPAVSESYHLGFSVWAPGYPLGKDRLDIPAPFNDAEKVSPDIVLVPLLGFDSQGHRLGQGQGCYDEALWKLQKEKDFIAIGIAYTCQYLDNIPVYDKDYPMDYIITPENIVMIKESK